MHPTQIEAQLVKQDATFTRWLIVLFDQWGELEKWERLLGMVFDLGRAYEAHVRDHDGEEPDGGMEPCP
jgi:hypothetical protein